MIQILTGDNQYLIKQRIDQLTAQLAAPAKIYYADEQNNLIDQIMAQDLFSQKQVIVIKNLTKNKQLTEQLIANFELIKDDQNMQLIIVETKLDKRLKLSKMAAKAKLIEQFDNPKHYDRAAAIENIKSLAFEASLKIDNQAAERIWQLVGVDMMTQSKVIEQLSIVCDQRIELAQVDTYIMPNLAVDSFVVIDQLLAGKKQQLEDSIDKLEQTNVAAMAFWGLIVSQMTNLVVIKSINQLHPTKDFAIHPFVANKLKSAAYKLSLADIKTIIKILTETDQKLKSTADQQWLLLKIALVKICNLFQ